jgi:hypothetical protein
MSKRRIPKKNFLKFICEKSVCVPQSKFFMSKRRIPPKTFSQIYLYLCSLAGRYDNPIPTRFLAPIHKVQIV